MKFITFLISLSILSLAFANSYPPINEVVFNNLQNAPNLVFYNAFSGNGEAVVENPVSYANITIELVSPSVDNNILSNNSNYLFFSRNSNYLSGGQYTRNAGSGLGLVCDEILSTEFENSYSVASAHFSFKNKSSSVEINPNSNYLSLPNDLALEETDGSDNLSVTISGSFYFNYSRTDNNVVISHDSEGNPSCGSVLNKYDKIYKIDFFSSKNFIVSGLNSTHLLIAPITGEQWYKNNKFDTITLSKRRFYLVDVVLSNEMIASKRLKTFEIYTAPNGLKSIYNLDYGNNKSGSGGSDSSISVGIYQNSTTPIPIEQANHSFFYLYAVNSSYTGLGDNNLTLVFYDYFGNNLTFKHKIRSNALSAYSNLAEEKTNYTRKSAPFYYSEYKEIGGLGVVILFIFILYGTRLFRQ